MCEWVSAQMIRQYVYCPRKIYFMYVLGFNTARTPQVKRGEDIHMNIWYSPKKVSTGSKIVKVERGVPVADVETCLRGQIDLLLLTKDEEHIPVEVKTGFSGVLDLQHIVQLETYLVILNDNGYKAPYGILYYKDKKKSFEIPYTKFTKDKIMRLADQVRSIIRSAVLPKPTEDRVRCGPCEFSKFCGD